MVEVKLKTGESMYTQSGSMAYQTEGIEMSTNARGGIMKSLGRMFTNESIFMANYTATKEGAIVSFASTVPGSIMPVDIGATNGGLIIQKGSFLCAENSINTEISFTKRFSSGLFGGEGFILQKATGTGMLFLEIDGDPVVKDLQPGEVLKVDTGNIVAFEPNMSYEVETVKGIKNIVFGGEGLFLTRIVGPGKVILQSQNFRDFANRLIPYMPKSSN